MNEWVVGGDTDIDAEVKTDHKAFGVSTAVGDLNREDITSKNVRKYKSISYRIDLLEAESVYPNSTKWSVAIFQQKGLLLQPLKILLHTYNNFEGMRAQRAEWAWHFCKWAWPSRNPKQCPTK